MNTNLYGNSVEGTHIVFHERAREVRVTVAVPPFSKLTMALDLDDVDRLLAVREHAAQPVWDIAEFFQTVHHCPPRAANAAARAFVACAGSLAEIVYG